MDIRKLLETMTVLSDEDSTPSKGGTNLLKDLVVESKQLKEKTSTLEQRITEKWAEFKDTFEKRTAREGSRHPRGHEPQEQYKVLQDESSESEKRVATKLKNIERLKTPISDEEWEKHQKLMKKEREEWIKDNPNSIFKEDEVLAVKEDPFGQWVIWDKVKNKVRKAFDNKESAYGYLEHVLSNDKDYSVMHGSEVIELSEYGTMQNIKPGDTATNDAEPDKETAQNIATATTTIKQATGSTTTPADLAKSIDKVDQGTATLADQQKLGNVMDVISKAAKDPELANQFKQLAQKASQK